MSTKSNRYAAKLLFQFRVDIDGDPGKRRLCEERIINFDARSPVDAMKIVKRVGKKEEHSYKNAENNKVYFEFVGIMDLMSLDCRLSEGEVWYDIYERVLPMERREKILPKESELLIRLGASKT